MSATEYSQDSYQRPEHHLHGSNEPLQPARPGVTDTGAPTGQYDDSKLGRTAGVTGQHDDSKLGRTAGAGVTDQYNTTQPRAAGTGVAGQQYDCTEGAGVTDQYNTTQPRTTGTGVAGQQNDRTAGAGIADQYNTTQPRTIGTGVAGQQNDRTAGAGVTGVAGQQYDPYFANASSNRPLDVKPTPQGGVATGGRSDLPLGYADLGDKIIGKTQKVVAKVTNDPKLHEKGELREFGGRAAVHGQARAPHD